MNASAFELVKSIGQRLAESEAQLARGGAEDISQACKSLEDAASLFSHLIRFNPIKEIGIRNAITGIRDRIDRCERLLDTAGAFHRGLATGTGLSGTFYKAGGLAEGWTEGRPQTALNA